MSARYKDHFSQTSFPHIHFCPVLFSMRREYGPGCLTTHGPLAIKLTQQEYECANLLTALTRGTFGQTLEPKESKKTDEAVSKRVLNDLLRLRERSTKYRTRADRTKAFQDDPKCGNVPNSKKKSVRCLDCPPGKKNEWQLDKRGEGYDYNWHKHRASHCADRLVALFKRLGCQRKWLMIFLVDLDQSLAFTRSLSDETDKDLTEEEREDLECLYKQTKLKIKKQKAWGK